MMYTDYILCPFEDGATRRARTAADAHGRRAVLLLELGSRFARDVRRGARPPHEEAQPPSRLVGRPAPTPPHGLACCPTACCPTARPPDRATTDRFGPQTADRARCRRPAADCYSSSCIFDRADANVNGCLEPDELTSVLRDMYYVSSGSSGQGWRGTVGDCGGAEGCVGRERLPAFVRCMRHGAA